MIRLADLIKSENSTSYSNSPLIFQSTEAHGTNNHILHEIKNIFIVYSVTNVKMIFFNQLYRLILQYLMFYPL